MSSVGDAFTGATSGVSDTTLSDAALGSDLTGGSTVADSGSSFFGGSGGPSEFGTLSDIANAFSGGGTSPTSAQSIAMTPPSASAATGGDPVGAAGGTQSATTPGASPATPQQGGGGQNQQSQGDQQHASPAAVDQLKALLKQLQGKPTGPTGQIPLPSLSAGQTGAQSPQMPLPTLTAGQTGPPSSTSAAQAPIQSFPDFPGGGSQPAGASIPPGAAAQPTAQATADDGTPKTDASGQPVTAAGTPASQTPTPPARPTDDQGRQITVNKPGAGAQPQPTQTADLPTRVPHPDTTALPTHKGGPSPAPAPSTSYPATTQIQRDITGVSTGSPTALADLARAAMTLAPLIGMFMGGGGRRGHRGGFQGMRGFRPFGRPGGMGFRHPGGGPWLYHHPGMGWRMHHFNPGPGWLPLNPMDAQGMGIMGDGQQGGQDPNAPDPNRPPKETGATVGTPDQVGTSGAIPGVSAKEVDDYTRATANKYGINPDIASKILGQESSYGQARRPGDNGTSFGPFQLHFAPDGRAMGDDFMRDTHLDPRDPSTWKAQIDYAMKRAAMGGWGPWTTTMNKLGLNQWSGITTNRRFAGKPMSNQQPNVQIAITPNTIPPTSQPMVAGGP